jgi:hypothetical protein
VSCPALPRRLGPLATVAALAFAGCSSSSVQTDASVFVNEHRAGAARVAAATKAVEAGVSQLSSSPTPSQLKRLAAAARQAHRDTVGAGEWRLGGGPEEISEGTSEEENLPRAESQVITGANDLAAAMSALRAYARPPSAARLTRYRERFEQGREQWNEGATEIWYLAHAARAPTV